MQKLTIGKKLLLPAAFLLHLISLLFLNKTLSDIRYLPVNPFVFDLIGKPFVVGEAAVFLAELGNFALITVLSMRLFKTKYFIPVFIFALLPWTAYLTAAGSFYIYLLFLVLLGVYGYMLVAAGKRLGLVFVFLSLGLGAYSSFMLFFLNPALLAVLAGLKLVSLRLTRLTALFGFIIFVPLIFLVLTNQANFKNTAAREVKLFSDPGLINTVNKYQGDAKKSGLGLLSKLAENRYIFQTEYIFLKYVKSIAPGTLFTPQEKLLTFSFTPPVYLGFFVPFVYGLWHLLRDARSRKFLLAASILTLPSILAKPAVDLNRLVVIVPAVVFIISLGLNRLYEKRQTRRSYFVLAAVVLIVLFQTGLTVVDITTKERARFVQYYGRNFNLGQQ